jgi:putative flippase GtrA
MRHHATAIAATLVDYSGMVAAVELFHVRPVPATALGAFGGAVTNFTLNRYFTYRAQTDAIEGQIWRYALVSAASLALNTGGMWLFHDRLGIQYLAARIISSVLVSNGWNYPMQRFFVFSAARRRTQDAGRKNV